MKLQFSSLRGVGLLGLAISVLTYNADAQPKAPSRSDINRDGSVNAADQILLIRDWHQLKTPQPEPTPEGSLCWTFDAGRPSASWEYFSSHDPDRIRVLNGRLVMEATQAETTQMGIGVSNEAILTTDLQTPPDLNLFFFQASVQDEPDPLPPVYTGHAFGDGVSISSNGSTWYTILNAQELEVGLEGETFTIDMSREIDRIEFSWDPLFGSSPTYHFKFQQYDNYALDGDGRQWDDICLLEQPIKNEIDVAIDSRHGGLDRNPSGNLATGSDYATFRHQLATSGFTLKPTDEFIFINDTPGSVDIVILQQPYQGDTRADFSDNEMAEIGEFVEKGGGLLVVADGGSGSISVNLNKLVQPFGIAYDSQDSSITQSFFGFNAHEITNGLSFVGIDFVRLIEEATGQARLLTTIDPSPSDDFLAVWEGSSGQGRAVFLGDGSLWKDAGTGADFAIDFDSNGKLLDNIINFLVGSR